MKSTKREPLKFAPRPNPREIECEQRQRDFLRFLAQGESIHDACALLGITRHAYEKWRNRHDEFPAAVAAARESHRRDIACGFHTADAYARILLDAIQRDEALPAGLRYRAAKSILTRKGKADWLPDPLPADAAPLAPYEDNQPEFGETSSPDAASPTPQSPEPAPFPNTTAPNAPALSVPLPSAPSLNVTEAAATEPSSPEPARKPAPSRKPVLVSAAIDAPRFAQIQHENPDNPDNLSAPEITTNPLRNQRDTATQAAPAQPLEFSANPDNANSPKSAAQRQATSASTATAAAATQAEHMARTATDHAAKTATLSETWLSAHFLHKHESKPAFEALLARHIHALAPATPAEELLVFRIAQKAWLLRRLETWECVIADSRIAKVRQQHPSAAAPACLALGFLEAGETEETRFHQRIATLRKEHESTQDRLESKLSAAQHRREARERREAQRSASVQLLTAGTTDFSSPAMRTSGVSVSLPRVLLLPQGPNC